MNRELLLTAIEARARTTFGGTTLRTVRLTATLHFASSSFFRFLQTYYLKI